MSDYPLCTLKRAKKSGRRKGDSLRPSAAESPPAKGRPGCRKGWNKTRRFPAQGRRAAAEYGAPVRPQKSLAGKMTHLSTPFLFLSAYHKKGGASREILDRAGAAQTGGLTTRLRACRDAPAGGLQAAPTSTRKAHKSPCPPCLPEHAPAGYDPALQTTANAPPLFSTFRSVVGAACMPPGRRSCGNAVLRADSPFSDVP